MSFTFTGTFNHNCSQAWPVQQLQESIDLRVPNACKVCRKILTLRKKPIADITTGHGYCDLLCYALDHKMLDVKEEKR